MVNRKRKQPQHKWLDDRIEEVKQILGGRCSNPACRCNDTRVLQFDHVHGFGTYEIGRYRNYTNYRWDMLQQVRCGSQSFRLLCATCNFIDGAQRQRERRGNPKKSKASASEYYYRSIYLEELRQSIGHACRRCPESHPDAMQTHHVGGGGQLDRPRRKQKFISAIRRDGGSNTQSIRRMVAREQAAPGSLVTLCANCHIIAHWEEKRGIFYKYRPAVRAFT